MATKKQKQLVKKLIDNNYRWIDYKTDKESVEVVCSLVNLGIAKISEGGKIKIKSEEKAIRFLGYHHPFYNAKGELTSYALACGYIEKEEKNEVEITLWYEDVYHVRAHDFNEHRRIFWESFETLTDARKKYYSAIREFLV